ncbi:MAG: hypothetical protein BalsKO_06200 [Balneolaceae bacterium]
MKKIEEAVEVLGQHITEIATVTEWADKMEYKTSKYFSKVFLTHFGVRPKEVLIKKKLEKVKACLNEDSEDIYFSIARKLGFVDHNALYKFVNRHTDKTITEFKKESKKGE